MSQDDDFKPRLGKIRAQGSRRSQRYLARVLRAASVASGRALGRLGPSRRFDGSRIGRGAGAGRVLADRHAAFRARRVVIKARIVKIGARGLKAARLHLRYIQRDGVTREGLPGELYDATREHADGTSFLERADGDRHQFRFIVAVEDGVEYEELRGFTRRLMAQMEQDLDTKLDWVAVDHFNTGRPHTHVIVRGKDDQDRDLVIAREYIAHGMRQRAVEIATLDLGPRTDLEIERKLNDEVEQDRLTSLDRGLLREAQGGGLVHIATTGGGEHQRFRQALRAGRLQHLRRLGLAEEVAPGQWHLSKDLEAVLRRMGERGDIVKTMHRAMTRAKLDRAVGTYTIFDAGGANQAVLGKLVERGLHDANDRHYMIVDAVDGRSYWVDIGADDSVESVGRGAIVSIRPRPAEALPSDRTIAEIASRSEGRYSADLHRAHDPKASAAFVAAHVRRLEALRRAGIGERAQDGSWRIPGDSLEKARSHEWQRSRRAPVTVDVVSTAGLEKQVSADAATWLDRQLVGDAAADARDSGFGREVKGAVAQRRQWLIAQGLAEERPDQVVYRANLLAILRRRELARVAVQVSGELRLPYAEFGVQGRVEGKYVKPLDLVSGRFAVIERARDFTLVPWRPVLDRNLGKTVSGILRGNTISWGLQRQRSPGSP
jgi:type IV secretory pathway VirD2 relaxase